MQLSVASTFRRTMAFFMDQAIQFVLFLPLWMHFFKSYLTGQDLELEISWLFFAFAYVFLYKWMFLRFMGGTIGKLIMGLRVVEFRTDKPLTWMQSFLRVLTDQFSIFFGSAHRMFALMRFDRRHLSDWIANTQVKQLSKRSGYSMPHVLSALLLMIYFSSTQFKSIYYLFSRIEWMGSSIIIHP